MQPSTLSEHLEHWADELTVDATERIVRNVALAGQLSRNGYCYAESALLAGVTLYENKPVFLDHAENRQRPLDRSARDLVGSIVRPRFENGRIRGDICVLDTETGRLFLKLVESNAPGVGMSHVVLAERSADSQVVEKIVDVLSVDVVINPATTTTFRESCSDGSDRGGSAGPVDTPDETRLLAEKECSRLTEQNRQLSCQLAALQEQEQVHDLLRRSGLPESAVSDCFRRQLIQAGTLLHRRQLIDDRIQLWEQARRLHPVMSQPRLALPSEPSCDDAFLKVLRRRSS